MRHDYSKQVGRGFGIDEQLNAAGDPWLSPDEPCPFQRYQHLVNRRWADLKIIPQIGLRRRAAVQPGVGVDICEILALFGRELFCRLAHFLRSDSAVRLWRLIEETPIHGTIALRNWFFLQPL